MAEEEGNSGMDMRWLISEGLRYEVAEKRHVQSWNTLDKKLLVMITVNHAGERH